MSLRFLGLSLVSGSKSGMNLGSLGAFLVLALLFCSGVPQFGVLSGFPAAGMGGTQGHSRSGFQVPVPHLKLIQFGIVG